MIVFTGSTEKGKLVAFFGCKSEQVNNEYKPENSNIRYGSLTYFFTKSVLELKENTSVEINVYDLSGKIVSTVYNGTLNSGKNELKINTSDLQDGIYYTRINSNNSVKTIKMNVLR